MSFQPHNDKSYREVVEEDEPGPTNLPHVTEHGGALVSSVSNDFRPTFGLQTSIAFVSWHICNIKLWFS